MRSVKSWVDNKDNRQLAKSSEAHVERNHSEIDNQKNSTQTKKSLPSFIVPSFTPSSNDPPCKFSSNSTRQGNIQSYSEKGVAPRDTAKGKDLLRTTSLSLPCFMTSKKLIDSCKDNSVSVGCLNSNNSSNKSYLSQVEEMLCLKSGTTNNDNTFADEMVPDPRSVSNSSSIIQPTTTFVEESTNTIENPRTTNDPDANSGPKQKEPHEAAEAAQRDVDTIFLTSLVSDEEPRTPATDLESQLSSVYPSPQLYRSQSYGASLNTYQSVPYYPVIKASKSADYDSKIMPISDFKSDSSSYMCIPDMEHIEQELMQLSKKIIPGQREKESKKNIFESLALFLPWVLGHDSQLYVAGSTAYDVDSAGSDLDAVIIASHVHGSAFNVLERVKKHLRAAQKRADNSLDWCLLHAKMELLYSARVPILTLKTPNGVVCDVSVNKLNSIKHTEFFKKMLIRRPRYRSLIRLVKYWVKERDLPNMREGGLPSLVWILIVAAHCNEIMQKAENEIASTGSMTRHNPCNSPHADQCATPSGYSTTGEEASQQKKEYYSSYESTFNDVELTKEQEKNYGYENTQQNNIDFNLVNSADYSSCNVDQFPRGLVSTPVVIQKTSELFNNDSNFEGLFAVAPIFTSLFVWFSHLQTRKDLTKIMSVSQASCKDKDLEEVYIRILSSQCHGGVWDELMTIEDPAYAGNDLTKYMKGPAIQSLGLSHHYENGYTDNTPNIVCGTSSWDTASKISSATWLLYQYEFRRGYNLLSKLTVRSTHNRLDRTTHFRRVNSIVASLFESISPSLYRIPTNLSGNHLFLIVLLEGKLHVIKVTNICVDSQSWWSQDFLSRRDIRSVIHGEYCFFSQNRLVFSSDQFAPNIHTENNGNMRVDNGPKINRTALEPGSSHSNIGASPVIPSSFNPYLNTTRFLTHVPLSPPPIMQPTMPFYRPVTSAPSYIQLDNGSYSMHSISTAMPVYMPTYMLQPMPTPTQPMPASFPQSISKSMPHPMMKYVPLPFITSIPHAIPTCLAHTISHPTGTSLPHTVLPTTSIPSHSTAKACCNTTCDSTPHLEQCKQGEELPSLSLAYDILQQLQHTNILYIHPQTTHKPILCNPCNVVSRIDLIKVNSNMSMSEFDEPIITDEIYHVPNSEIVRYTEIESILKESPYYYLNAAKYDVPNRPPLQPLVKMCRYCNAWGEEDIPKQSQREEDLISNPQTAHNVHKPEKRFRGKIKRDGCKEKRSFYSKSWP